MNEEDLSLKYKGIEREVEDLSLRYSTKKEEPPRKPLDTQQADALIESMRTALEARLNPPAEEPVFYLQLAVGNYFKDAATMTSNNAAAAYMDTNLAEKVLRRMKVTYPKAQLIKSLPVWWTPPTKYTLSEVGYPEVLPAVRTAITDAILDGVTREDIKKFVLEVLHDNKE